MLLSDLPFYMQCELKEVPDTCAVYPVGMLNGEIRIDFIHYRSFQEAREKWEIRKKRIRYENLFLMMTDRDGCTEDQMRRFDTLPYPAKIIFTCKDHPDVKSAVWCSEYAEEREVPILTAYRNLRGERLYDRYFDFVHWLNKGSPKRRKP